MAVPYSNTYFLKPLAHQTIGVFNPLITVPDPAAVPFVPILEHS